MNDKIQLKRGTLANWLKADPILMDGEMALVATDDSKPTVYDSQKVGDGIHKFSELEMLGYKCLQELGDSQKFPLSQKAITDWINMGYQFRGVATPSTNPGTPDGPAFYIASEPGTYTNFDGLTIYGNSNAYVLYRSGHKWLCKSLIGPIDEIATWSLSSNSSLGYMLNYDPRFYKRRFKLSKSDSWDLISTNLEAKPNNVGYVSVWKDNKRVGWKYQEGKKTFTFSHETANKLAGDNDYDEVEIAVFVYSADDSEQVIFRVKSTIQNIADGSIGPDKTTFSAGLEHLDNASFFAFTNSYKLNSFVKELYLEDLDLTKEYRFRYIARNSNGVWNIPICEKDESVALKVAYQFYETHNKENLSVLELGPGKDYPGKKGYIVVDWNEWTDGVEGIIENTLNNKRATDIRFSPLISAYLSTKAVGLSQSKYKELFNTYENKKPNLLTLSKSISTSCDIINVTSQSDFDALSSNITQLLTGSSTKDILVLIHEGLYVFKNNHISLRYIVSNQNICIKGIGNVQIVGGEGLNESEISYDAASGMRIIPNIGTFNYRTPFISVNSDNKASIVPLSSTDDIDIIQLDELIEVVDADNKTCRCKFPYLISETNIDVSLMKIRVFAWYLAKEYSVLKIENGYVYFIATDLEYNEAYKCYNINLDYGFGKQYPRYKILNCNVLNKNAYVDSSGAHIPMEYNNVYKCPNSTFIKLDNLNIKSLSVSGLKIIGCGNLEKSVINIDSCTFTDGCWVRSNVFSDIYCDYAVNIRNSKNVVVSNNRFYNTFGQCVNATAGATNVQIYKNVIKNTGLGNSNFFAIVCSFVYNYYIGHNDISDFSYGAIGVGVHTSNNAEGADTNYGIVEYNRIYQTDKFISRKGVNTLMDSGAIYTWTKKKEVIIRNNYIYNIAGMYQNYGIFCDDGSKNNIIYSNIVGKIQNNNCLDLRYVPSVQEGNTGNLVMYNIFDGSFRMQENDDPVKETNNVLGKNIIVCNVNEPPIIENIKNKEPNAFFKNSQITSSSVLMSKETITLFKEVLPFLKNLYNYMSIKY